MARFLFITAAEKGHLNPVIGVGQRLLRRGHEVGFLTLPHPPPQLEALGFKPVHARLPPGPEHVVGGEALATLVRDGPALSRWIRSLLLDAVEPSVGPVREALAAFAPDACGVDGMLYQGVFAAHAAGLPYLGISSALTLLQPRIPLELLDTLAGLSDERRALFAKHGLSDPRFRTCEFLSPYGNVIFATPALVGDDADLPPATSLVGPSTPLGQRGDEPPFDDSGVDPERPLVYASFGSQISHQPKLFSAIAEACAPLDVQLLLSAGALAGTDFAKRLPGRVAVAPYVPQLAVLRKAAAFISHGGANSVMEASLAGVPLLLIPVCNDQPVQAHFVTRAGTGLSLAPEEASPERIRDSLARLLDPDGPHRRAASRVRESYVRHDGASLAADQLEALARG